MKQLAERTGRKRGEIHYFIMQLLSGHGLFRTYLHGESIIIIIIIMGKLNRSDFISCKQELDDLHHMFLPVTDERRGKLWKMQWDRSRPQISLD